MARRASPAAIRNPIGTHVLVGRGLVAGAVAQADELGCETLQIFAGNPRGWALTTGDAQQDQAFRDACSGRGWRVFVHAPYLVNPGSPAPDTYRNSIASVAHNLTRAAALGAEGVVVHTGSYVDPSPGDEGRLAALLRVREGLLPVLDGLTEDDPWLLLEPTAGQGRSLCAGIADLEPYLAALDHHPKVGICLDTCHVFAAGAPLDEPGGATAVLDQLGEVAGPGRLRLIHANDSLDVRGSTRDRHERIGAGHIGTGAFIELFAHLATDGVPFILETPGSRGADDGDIPVLKRLRARAQRATTGRTAKARR